jgi:hypothetical protein
VARVDAGVDHRHDDRRQRTDDVARAVGPDRPVAPLPETDERVAGPVRIVRQPVEVQARRSTRETFGDDRAQERTLVGAVLDGHRDASRRREISPSSEPPIARAASARSAAWRPATTRRWSVSTCRSPHERTGLVASRPMASGDADA